MKNTRLLLICAVVAAASFGCSDEDSDPVDTMVGTEEEGSPATETPGDDASDDTSEPGQPGGGTEPPESTLDIVAPLPQGEHLMGVSLAAVGGLVIPYKLTVDGMQMEIQAVGEGMISDVLATVDNVGQDADGNFEIFLRGLVMPAAYTPTGTEVTVDLDMTGTARSNTFLCGTVEGFIFGPDLDLAGSTFAITPWGDGTGEALGSCDGARPEVPRLDTCPAVTEGLNEGFLSNDVARRFDVTLPSDYDANNAYPLLFVYHGLGGGYETLLDLGFRDVADSDGMIVVAPDGLTDSEGTSRWDTFEQPEYNGDIAFFDDMLKCVGEAFTVDAERVYATGMSFGGLMTSTLAVTRSDVLAAAAPFSGGLTLNYEASTQIPVLMSWGGVNDEAAGQDFHLLSTEMRSTLVEAGNFVVACNHGLEHEIFAEFIPWAVRFLKDHPRGVTPEPYAGGLPDGVFPDYCEIASE